jgi:hypothetical protein
MKVPHLLKQVIAIAGLAAFFAPTYNLRADDVNNLIEFVLDSSPQEQSKLAEYNKSSPKKANKSAQKTSAKGNAKPAAPTLETPENLLFDAAAKLPNDIKGNYIYGTVTFKAVRQLGEEPYIQFGSKNGRISQVSG